MGQHLSEPITTKDTTSFSNSQFKCASTSMQGWRINMEDSHTHFLSLKEDKDASFFAVFDGHGGSRVAQWCGEHLHKDIINNENYAKGDYVSALKGGFLDCDENMLHDEEMKGEPSGATAVCVLLKNGKIHCGNCGDSRSVASVAGVVQALSYDHKPSNEEETQRIIAAGGYVELNRVNGNLALSRAMGDFIFKKNTKKPPEEQIVTAYPDVIVADIVPEHEFIVLACDGIWDVLTNQEVVDFVRKRIASKMEPDEICEELLNHCLAPDCQMGGLGCDNMTVILVCLLHGNSYEDLAEKCSKVVLHEAPMEISNELRTENGTVECLDDDDEMSRTPTNEKSYHLPHPDHFKITDQEACDSDPVVDNSANCDGSTTEDASSHEDISEKKEIVLEDSVSNKNNEGSP